MLFEVNEHSSAEYSADLKDQDGNPVGVANLTLARLTLYDRDTDTVLNERDDQDILNANDVTIEDVTAGSTITRTRLVWALQPEDNVVIRQARLSGEPHLALFSFEWAGGGHHHHQATIYVRPLQHVPRDAEEPPT